MKGRFVFFSALTASLAALASAIAERAFAFISAAMPPTWRITINRALAADGPALAYGAPAPHFLRHEAGRSRLAAARGI